ncbi:alcohol dehydrogenase catalytic domain-containing protein [Siccibacter turicensis]|uniref:alcohol dehydrogenase catalytic domain-containing protein n=1 Tax=Siccibacter turicensis TaxID=357233 RepID=UPI002A6A438A|nr:alcohol dehydrogenase catalytic domain-containing protein [Siccibacter turicensis]MDY0971414.1 alcohol dehydrogenase catalytic domain-containing protein [Siccibacter turicensis]
MIGKVMRAARMHEKGKPLDIDEIDIPQIRPTEVLVRVRACGMVPNLQNVLDKWDEMAPDLPLPKMPAIFGLDVAGEVVRTGERVRDFKPGDRVYVNPLRVCGSCSACRNGHTLNCERMILNGYFGIKPESATLFEDYPYGGYAEYLPAPQESLVRIPENLDFPVAARLGYLGTAYRALKRGNAGPGKTVMINGITGTLGLGAVALSLALGVRQILGTARDESLFERVAQLAEPGRIQILKSGEEPADEWSQRVTGGRGVDIAVDALSPGAPPEPMKEAVKTLNRGGCLVNIGMVSQEVPLDVFWMMSNNISHIGSSWFSTEQGQEMADLVESGALDLSFFDNQAFPLEQINEAVGNTKNRSGGFTNIVITP